MREMKLTNWETNVADHRQIPVPDSSADLVISGWSFCYLAVWGGADWQSALQDGLHEIERILRPGGMMLIIESLGTGTETPRPPEHLEAVFRLVNGGRLRARLDAHATIASSHSRRQSNCLRFSSARKWGRKSTCKIGKSCPNAQASGGRAGKIGACSISPIVALLFWIWRPPAFRPGLAIGFARWALC